MDSTDTEQLSLTGFCEDGDELLGPIRDWEF
jgi:hypothetical protein